MINADDPYASQLAGLARRTLTYGLKGTPDLTAKKFALSFNGLEFTAQTPAGKIEVRLAARRPHQRLQHSGGDRRGDRPRKFPSPKSKRASRISSSFPGDFSESTKGQPFLVVVDYAHTDDALRNLISTARELSPSARIITVFGAGGERDRTKRPLMGEAAGSLSDLVVLTSDNPRSEDPLRIINDVVVGLQKANAKYRIEPDRERRSPLQSKRREPGDIVLLAGKGHETYQVLRDGTVEFDDREKARAILRRKGFSKKRQK